MGAQERESIGGDKPHHGPATERVDGGASAGRATPLSPVGLATPGASAKPAPSVPLVMPAWLMDERGERQTNKAASRETKSVHDCAGARHLAALRRRLRRERALARCGHFAYDLSRHLALTRLVKSLEGRVPTPKSKKPHLKDRTR